MKYKGYSANIEYSDDDGCFVGRVSGIRDIITFHGESVAELRNAFREAIDFYLDSQQENEVEAHSYTGRLTLRIPPELHGEIAVAARQNRKSINTWITEACQKIAADRSPKNGRSGLQR